MEEKHLYYKYGNTEYYGEDVSNTRYDTNCYYIHKIIMNLII